MIAADPDDPKGIVWIASYPKSGNTWVRVFLHHLIRQAAGRPLEEHDIDELSRTSRSAAGRVDLFERILGKPVTEADAFELAAARPTVQEAIMEEGNGLVFAKTHCFLGRVFDFPLINRSASAGGVYVVRNPLDIAVSLAFHLDVTFDSAIRSMGARLNASVGSEIAVPEIWGSWTENVASWTVDAPPVIHVVRYEDLLADPREQFVEIVEHMRLDATPEQIDEAIALASFDRLRAEEDTRGFAERPENAGRFFRQGTAGQWREQLSADQVERIVADHGEQMRRFGYLPVN